jgi:hypothetical protein
MLNVMPPFIVSHNLARDDQLTITVLYCLRFEVLRRVKMLTVFWVAMPCGLVVRSTITSYV